MDEITNLIKKLINLELNKNDLLPWYLACVFLKLNPKESIFLPQTGSKHFMEYSYDDVASEVKFISWFKADSRIPIRIDSGTLKNLPVPIGRIKFCTKKPM